MAKKAKNLSYLRAVNQGAILKTVLTHGTVTKQLLAAALSLTPMSISYMTTDLLEKGILLELPGDASPDSSPGRRAAKIQLAPGQVLAVGVSVSRRSVRSSLVDLMGNVLSTVSAPVKEKTTQSVLTRQIITQVEGLLADCDPARVLGIGVSCVGLVDVHTNTVVSTTGFYGVRDWPIGDLLGQHFHMPVFVVEDMKASGLAESFYGSAKEYTDFVYVGITHGIGAGIISNGKLVEGIRGFSGEIGHTTLYQKGKKCSCGNTGCAEMYLSVPAVLQRAKVDTWDEFLDRCDKQPNDPVVEQFLADLGAVLVNVVNLFDTQAVVVGHEGARLTPYCFDRLQVMLNERAITRDLKKVKVHPSALAEDITAQSGAAVVFARLFQGEFRL